jgi:hypothetical protein
MQVAAGGATDVALDWRATGLKAGAHEGTVRVVAATNGVEARVPYWYAVTSGVPAEISVLDATSSGRRSGSARDAVLFRVLDAAGLPLTSTQPVVSVISGGGAVQSIDSYDQDVPGVYSLSVRLGPLAGSNVFRLQAGDAVVEVTITGQ